MTREYVYYPYVFESDPKKFPEKIRKIFDENMSVQMNMSHIIKKLVFLLVFLYNYISKIIVGDSTFIYREE